MTTSTVILNSGGIRSFVAAAAVLSAKDRPKAILLHLLDDRPNSKVRSEYVRRQGEHLGVDDILEIPLRYPKPHRRKDQGPSGPPVLRRTQTLVTALAQTIELGIQHLIWPAQANGDFDLAAQITEQTVLTHHLAKLEQTQPPAIDTPLLELTDKQLVELAGQLNLPWKLAWSCLLQGERPCRLCDGCRRRREAFEVAGMIDPVVAFSTADGLS